jgi:hypothetical protein
MPDQDVDSTGVNRLAFRRIEWVGLCGRECIVVYSFLSDGPVQLQSQVVPIFEEPAGDSMYAQEMASIECEAKGRVRIR